MYPHLFKKTPAEFTTGTVAGLAPNFILAKYNRLLAIRHYQSSNLFAIQANVNLTVFTAPGLS
jgi:hypothetical protein